LNAQKKGINHLWGEEARELGKLKGGGKKTVWGRGVEGGKFQKETAFGGKR